MSAWVHDNAWHLISTVVKMLLPSLAPPGNRLSKEERSHIGVGQLRRFLEQLLQRRYLDNVPLIVPLLEKEQRNAQVGSWPCLLCGFEQGYSTRQQ